MRPNCRDAVQEVAKKLGREPLTDAQINAIDERLSSTMRRLARRKDWQGLSADDRVRTAAEVVMGDIKAEAERKVANAQLQILKTAATEARITEAARQSPGDKRAHNLVADIEHTGDYIQGLKMEAVSGLMDTMDAVKSGEGASFGRKVSMFLFDAQNPQMTKDLSAEIFRGADGSTGNQVAKDGAKAWLDTMEAQRQRFNRAGGDVGKLGYGYLPQPHDSARVRGAGLVKWVNDIMPRLDRTRYLDEAGNRLNDVDVAKVLEATWRTISSDGLNQQDPGAFKGEGARANRGMESRELHFKDAEAFTSYMGDYGRGSMYDAMVAHIGRMARDIGLVERYGPNPNAQMRLQFDLAAEADGRSVDDLPRSFGLRPQSYWDSINGAASTPASARIAQIGTDVRNIQTFGKLGSAVISSITDLGTYITTTGYNKLGYWNAISNVGKVAGSADARRFLTTHGIIADSMIGDLNRWTSDNVKQTWSGRIANSTMKLSLMNAWTDTLRRAFSLTMMQGLARMSKTEWGKLTEWDRTHLERKGITGADWQVISRAELTHFQGVDHLTPEAIRAADVETARPEDLQRIRDAIQAQTTEMRAANDQDQAWVQKRLDTFDATRDEMNRRVKELAQKKTEGAEQESAQLRERIKLLEAHREQVEFEAQMEAEYNKTFTRPTSIRQGLRSAASIGRRLGASRAMIEARIAESQKAIGAGERLAGRQVNKAATAVEMRAEKLSNELSEFVGRARERQSRREALIRGLEEQEAPRLAAESQRITSEVVTKVLGLIQDESEYAVLNPDLATKAWASGGASQRGTVRGELSRSVMQFKSFPIAMISRHWRRMLDAPQVSDGSAPALANRTMYFGALMLTTTALGAIALQGKQVTQGKDPIDMTGPNATKFWLKAVAQGGGLSIVGDTLLNDPSSSPGDVVANATKTLVGPAIGTAGEAVLKVGAANVWEAAKGKPTHAAAETLNLLRANAPYVGLWYTKAAIDHAGMHALQENLSPGYLSKMQARAKKDFGQQYWWQPGTGFPDRGPDFEKAVGQ